MPSVTPDLIFDDDVFMGQFGGAAFGEGGHHSETEGVGNIL